MKHGVDISEWNGDVDFNLLREHGIEFVMVRCTMGKTQEDSMFRHNVAAAHEAGLLVGAYHYSYALTAEDAEIEARHCRDVINETGCLLELPVFFDMEDADDYKADHGFCFEAWNITAICKAFLDNLGLDCGVYASYSWLSNWIDWEDGLKGHPVWVAAWGNEDPIKGYMWQYTDREWIGDKQFDGDIMYA